MTLLILGILIWIALHWFKRFAPEARARLGEKGKGPIALGLLGSIVLMVIGYRGAEFVPVYTPMPGIGHLTVTLSIIAVYFTGIGSVKGVLHTKIRHPMLTGGAIWAVAHLLVNGDRASVLLFGAMLVWTLGQMVLINRAQGAWVRPEAGPWRKDGVNLVITAVIVVVITGIHVLLGHNPFLGTYG
jgi:uncharacterized membrane protein